MPVLICDVDDAGSAPLALPPLPRSRAACSQATAVPCECALQANCITSPMEHVRSLHEPARAACVAHVTHALTPYDCAGTEDAEDWQEDLSSIRGGDPGLHGAPAEAAARCGLQEARATCRQGGQGVCQEDDGDRGVRHTACTHERVRARSRCYPALEHTCGQTFAAISVRGRITLLFVEPKGCAPRALVAAEVLLLPNPPSSPRSPLSKG